MRDAADLLRGRLRRAVLRRRAPLWLATLLPLLACALCLPAARPYTLAAPPLWAVWLLWDLARWQRRVGAQWAAWLDAAVPALEDSSALLAGAAETPIARLQQERLRTRLAATLGPDEYRAIARLRAPVAALSAWLPMLLALAVAGAAWGWQQRQLTGAAGGHAAAPAARAIVDGEIYLRVAPPAYTGVAAFETAARDIEVPQYADVRWCVRNAGGAQPVVELSDGQALPVGADCARWRAGESIFWRARGKAGTRYNVRVRPDQAPQVSVVAPNELITVLPADAGGVQLELSARDDYAIVRASLHMTLARGSGENIRFSDREVPLPESADPKLRHWQKRWTLAVLGMEPGDELYFFVRATDNAPEHAHTTQSPTYTLRLPGPAAESLDATALPSMVKPESLRSQRQIIMDTEQLLADLQAKPNLPRATLRERSESIAGDQAQLRRRYGMFLGEESSLFGDEHEHEHEHEQEHGGGHAAEHGAPKRGAEAAIIAEFGHAHDQEDNATIFDPATKALLKRALAAMWDAEKSLRAITPKSALAPEYKALAAIKELQQAERVYLHRTAFVPPALREEKRMSGDMVGALSYKRAQGGAAEPAPAEVRELVLALAGDGTLPALWSKSAREIIAARITDQEQKLAAQRAVQDVADGCAACRAVLRAWLRGTLAEAPVRLQAQPLADTPFRRAWRGKEQP
ncbi:hypothetical protein ACFOLJ_07580 [Rugamonas sp. CCM 8940]|uniref:hypothetical protein n=1 Tax=Rugamonas sp. CCM 8940 TaxID=2765359 RepID=UPI0018F3D1E4|nr:hypothetical protein [Rugamonas sp. CCM 8940]MBJ7310187.1 hypothetical protein [Rugamonas sp. CCM 8940]